MAQSGLGSSPQAAISASVVLCTPAPRLSTRSVTAPPGRRTARSLPRPRRSVPAPPGRVSWLLAGVFPCFDVFRCPARLLGAQVQCRTREPPFLYPAVDRASADLRPFSDVARRQVTAFHGHLWWW